MSEAEELERAATETFRVNLRFDGEPGEHPYDVLEVRIGGEFVMRVEYGEVIISAVHEDEH